MNYIQKTYNVPAEYGRIIRFQGEQGIIIDAEGSHLKVLMDKDKPGHTVRLHPVWEVEYLGIGTPRKHSRSTQRYRDYIHSEMNMSFIDWLRYKQYEKETEGHAY